MSWTSWDGRTRARTKADIPTIWRLEGTGAGLLSLPWNHSSSPILKLWDVTRADPAHPRDGHFSASPVWPFLNQNAFVYIALCRVT